ncbi:hypothetical protein DPX39_100142600 [Trypanosoma brucei equiperdum]|nr:hypothetical protein DPX39_100142600 [Trypanosoma brucei equiperdum]
MAETFQLLPSEQGETLGRFCAAKRVNVTDVWLPLQLLRPARAKDDTPVVLSPSTAAVLLNHKTGKLTTRRSEILALVPVLFADERNFAFPLSAIPTDCTIFARASKAMASKRIPSGLTVMHRSVTPAQALAEGSCLSDAEPQPKVAKKQALSDSGLTVGSVPTAPASTDTSAGQVNKRARSDAAFDGFLQEALVTLRGGKSTPREGVIIRETLDNLIQVCNAPPLHFVTQNKRMTSLNVLGCIWNVPDERVIYRVFRRGGEGEGPSTSTHTDSERLIAVFIIDNVLLKREPAKPGAHNEGPLWSLVDEKLPEVARALSERGYRIVLLDHYPALHHGNHYALHTKLIPIAELCRQHFTADVTVVISAVSNISGSRRRDAIPFVLPHSGLWEFFVTQLNGGMRAERDSLLVGLTVNPDEEHRDMGCQGRRDVLFAINCGLRYVDGATVSREVLGHEDG